MIVALGYLASAFLAYSLIVTNAIKFRLLNILGCISFIIYGLVIGAFPVLVANTILLVINIYQLYKLYQSKEVFQLIGLEANNKIVDHFLSFYKTDIGNYFPKANTQFNKNTVAFITLRDLVIANIFFANVDENGNAYIEMNYTIPKYRDFKIGTFIFENERSYLLNSGIKRIVYNQPILKSHEVFIHKMGFVKETQNNQAVFVKQL